MRLADDTRFLATFDMRTSDALVACVKHLGGIATSAKAFHELRICTWPCQQILKERKRKGSPHESMIVTCIGV